MATSTTRELRPSRIPWPPLLIGGSLLAAALLEWLLPTHALFARVPSGTAWGTPIGGVWGIAGWSCIAFAICIDVWALRAFRRHKTTVLPNAGASALITTGPFAHSRNPIYIAHTALVVGIALLWPSAWLLALVPIKVMLVQRLAILPEEAHLHARFGKAWQDYAGNVGRWW